MATPTPELGSEGEPGAVDWSTPISAERMYGAWPLSDEAIEAALDRSRDPEPATSLYDLVADVGIGAGDRLLDIGGRDAGHALELAARHRCRVISVDPAPVHRDDARRAVADHDAGRLVDLATGTIEAIPAADGAFDAIWCRDVVSHLVDLDAALAECRRVLADGGPLIVYQTVATDWLGAEEAGRLYPGLAVEPDRMDPGDLAAAARRQGFAVERRHVVGSQWREAWEEDGSGRTARQLLHAARLIRAQDELVTELGADLYRVELANALWGVYQMIGKLEPRACVLR